MSSENIEVFPGKSLARLFEEIYDNTMNKRIQIQNFITQLHAFVNTASDAAIIIPMIKDYLDVSVRNDDQLIKVAQIVQRMTSAAMEATGGQMDTLLSEEEKKQLLGEVHRVLKGEDSIAKDVKQLPNPDKVNV